MSTENADLRKALYDIANGIAGSEEPSMELSPFEFRAAMWTWSQKRAREALEKTYAE